MKKKPTYKEFHAKLGQVLKQKQLPPLVLISGSSDFLILDCIQQLKKLWQKEVSEAVNTFEAKALNESSFAELWQQTSLFEPKALSFIRRCQENRNLHKFLKTIPNLAAIENPLVFVYDSEKPNAHAVKEMRRLGAYELAAMEPWPNEVPTVLSQLARRSKLAFEDDAIELFIESMGTDLIKLDNELKKFSMIFGSRQVPLKTDEIAPYLGMLRADHAFELDRHITSESWGKAHALLGDLLSRGEAPIRILGLLARHCRHALRIKQAHGMSPRDLGFKLRLPAAVVSQYQPYVKGRSSAHFCQTLIFCSQLDRLFKSSKVSEDIMLSQVIERLSTKPVSL